MHLAIDDFGTGYSSMGLIKQFPIDAIKVERDCRSRRRMGFCGQLVGASRVGRHLTTEPKLYGFRKRIRHRYNYCQQSQHQFVHRRPELQIRRLVVLLGVVEELVCKEGPKALLFWLI